MGHFCIPQQARVGTSRLEQAFYEVLSLVLYGHQIIPDTCQCSIVYQSTPDTQEDIKRRTRPNHTHHRKMPRVPSPPFLLL